MTEPEAAERFDPESMRDSIIEAEHIARYRWACQFARGRRILDAGCGLAYGAAMLHEAGADQVTGIDISEETLNRARPAIPDGVHLQVGDLRSLPFDDASFDLVVCFEAIEHVEPAEQVLDELARVLGSEGVLLISSPNRGVYTEGNPHHVREFTRDELIGTLGRRFSNVAVRGQRTWIASSVLDDDATRAEDVALPHAEVRKLSSQKPGGEIYTVVAATNGQVPAEGALVTLTAPVELRRWEQLWQEQRQVMNAQAEHAAAQAKHAAAQADRLHSLDAERGLLRERLLAAERQVAEVHTLRRDIQELVSVVDSLREHRDSLRQECDHLIRIYGVAMSSKSWRLTAPLRRLATLRRR
jgi:ubiquinone/menaquinone biosynthesis C-methylase UbiE